ncbi:MAG: VTT domain-containing protein [Candidatus Woesearchaeota archaeon]|jgi:membrane protein DedA with SNARE-associated domain|nr:VTT domain-containing protein [Candidatus Woesearchaeota archaeon]
MSIESLIINFSYVGLFILLIINGITSFPSSQILYIIAGYFAFTGDLNFWLVVIFGGLGMSIGNIILYEISRRKGLDYVLKINKFIGFEFFRKKDILRVNKVLKKKKGYIYLFFGKFINPIKIIIPIPAGMSHMNRFYFSVIIMITSFFWALAFTSFGFYFGKNYEAFGYYGAGMIILAVIFVFLFYKSMNGSDVVKDLEK